MIKIIKEGYNEPKTADTYTITCSTCGCVFEASTTDFVWVNRGGGPVFGAIKCPHCKKKVTVDKIPQHVEKMLVMIRVSE